MKSQSQRFIWENICGIFCTRQSSTSWFNSCYSFHPASIILNLFQFLRCFKLFSPLSLWAYCFTVSVLVLLANFPTILCSFMESLVTYDLPVLSKLCHHLRWLWWPRNMPVQLCFTQKPKPITLVALPPRKALEYTTVSSVFSQQMKDKRQHDRSQGRFQEPDLEVACGTFTHISPVRTPSHVFT